MKAYKFYILCAAALLLKAEAVKSQSTPEAFLGQLPPVPNHVCSTDSAVVNHFKNQVDKIISDLKEVADRISAERQPAFNKAIAAQAGLSMNDINQLKDENISEEQAHKIANKSLGNQYNLSMEELSKVANMSEEEQQKWAQQYANQQMQKAQKNPQATLKKQDKDERLFELAKEQKVISERMQSLGTKEYKLHQNIELQDTTLKQKLTLKAKPLESQICSGICTPAEIARSKAAEKQLYNLNLQYCEEMSSLEVNYISQYLSDLKMLLPDYRRLEEIENEMSKLQHQTSLPVKDLYCFDAVDKYAHTLSSAYNYWVGKSNQYSNVFIY